MSNTTKIIVIGCAALIVLLIHSGKPYAAIDPESIVGIWTFEEEDAEEIKDISGNGNNGIILGNPKWVDGQFGTAMDFRNLGDVVQIENFGLVAPQKEATITFWTELGDTADCDIVSFDPLVGDNRITIHFPWGNGVVWQHGTDQHFAGKPIPADTLGNWEFWGFRREYQSELPENPAKYGSV